MTDTVERDRILTKWWGASMALAKAKKEESELRAAAFALCFPAPKIGTNNLELGKGYILKAKVKQNFKVSGTDEQVKEVLQHLPEGSGAGLFRWKPELSQTVYKQLTREEKLIVNDILTISDGTPELEMVVPKADIEGATNA